MSLAWWRSCMWATIIMHQAGTPIFSYHKNHKSGHPMLSCSRTTPLYQSLSNTQCHLVLLEWYMKCTEPTMLSQAFQDVLSSLDIEPTRLHWTSIHHLKVENGEGGDSSLLQIDFVWSSSIWFSLPKATLFCSFPTYLLHHRSPPEALRDYWM